MNLGALEEDTFSTCCHLLLQKSEQLRDGWSWESVQGSPEGYLKKTALRSAVITSNAIWSQEGSKCNSEAHSCCQYSSDQQVSEKSVVVDEDDRGCTVPKGSSQFLQYEYHILYSCSYRTPVLYFRACTLEGRSLSLEEVWSSVHPDFQVRLRTSPLNTISQQVKPHEHNLSITFESPLSGSLLACGRSIPCWASLFLCCTPVERRSS